MVRLAESDERHDVRTKRRRQAPDGTRTELQAASGHDEVILLQLKIDPGSSGDPMARREVTRIAAPPGAKLEVIGS